MQARKIPAGDGRLRARAVGEIELDGKVLIIKRIHVAYTLTVDEDTDVSAVARIMGFYRDSCPVYRSISGSIGFSDEIEVRQV